MGHNLHSIDFGDQTPKALALGWDHSCAVMDNNIDVMCWGSNSKGQLGLGKSVSYTQTPTLPVDLGL